MNNLTKAEATKMARELAARLGKGWTPSVQQNIDWHYGAALAGADAVGAGASSSVLANPRFGAVDYTVYMNVGSLEVIKSGADPVKLVSEAKKEMAEKIRAIESAFNQMIQVTM